MPHHTPKVYPISGGFRHTLSLTQKAQQEYWDKLDGRLYDRAPYSFTTGGKLNCKQKTLRTHRTGDCAKGYRKVRRTKA